MSLTNDISNADLCVYLTEEQARELIAAASMADAEGVNTPALDDACARLRRALGDTTPV